MAENKTIPCGCGCIPENTTPCGCGCTPRKQKEVLATKEQEEKQLKETAKESK